MRLRVLIIDDDVRIAEIHRRYVEKTEGFEVVGIANTFKDAQLQFDVLEPEFLTALCRAYNNWMKDYCDFNPDRLKGVAMISLADIDGAIAAQPQFLRHRGLQ